MMIESIEQFLEVDVPSTRASTGTDAAPLRSDGAGAFLDVTAGE